MHLWLKNNILTLQNPQVWWIKHFRSIILSGQIMTIGITSHGFGLGRKDPQVNETKEYSAF